jgi:DNA polymerase III epsilon subunit-like protein
MMRGRYKGSGSQEPIEWMLDLETLSSRPNAYIFQVGLVSFDGHYVRDWRIRWMEQPGSHIDPSTLEWHLDQGTFTRDEVYTDHLADVLQQVDRYLHPNDIIWAQSPDFDCTILADAFRRLSPYAVPWKFWRTRCVRTILAGVDRSTLPTHESMGLTKHRAVDDCKVQIAQVLATRERTA